MTTTTAPAVKAPAVKAKQRPGDRWFSGTALAAGSMILVTLAAVAIFLDHPVDPRPHRDQRDRIAAHRATSGTTSGPSPSARSGRRSSRCSWPCRSRWRSRSSSRTTRRAVWRRRLGYIVDLLAAVPSVVFGLWGIMVLAPAVQPVYAWLVANMGWFPLFAGTVSSTGRTIFTAAIVLAVMVVPIITAICREIFLQTPVLHEEAALALGATRWEMIRMAVFPFGRSGIVSASMLGLGRALGETMAVAMVLSATGVVTFQLFTPENPSTIPANIALTFPEAYGTNINVLIATGLILFIVTFAVNALARWIVSRRKEFSGAN